MSPGAGKPKIGKPLLSTFPVRKVLRLMPFVPKSLTAFVRSHSLLLRFYCFPNKKKDDEEEHLALCSIAHYFLQESRAATPVESTRVRV